MLLLVGLVALAAEPRAEEQTQDKPESRDKANKLAKETTLPPGSIIAVYDNFRDALMKLPPGAFVLTPEKYKSLLDELERLKKQVERPSVRTPSRVQLKGKIEGNLATLSALFEFETEQANESVRLACSPGIATGVSLEGRTPRLRSPATRGRASDEEGFVVEIDKPGDHQLTLEFVLPVNTTSSGSSLALDLPRAAITTLELELPAGAREIRLGGKPLAESLLSLQGNRLSGGLGPVEKLELAWRGAGAAASTAVLEAEGQILTRVERREDQPELSTEAKLVLRTRGGQTNQWQLLVPVHAQIKVSPEDEARVQNIAVADQKLVSLRTIRLKEPSAAPLTVTILHSQAAPKPGSGKGVGIGPFAVVGAARQIGTLLVTNSLPDWHLEFTAYADLTRRGATDEELRREPNLAAAFRYGPGGGSWRGSPSWLEIEAESVRGQIKTRAAHLFVLTTDSPEGPRWQVQSSLTVTPRWAEVDRFSVRLPEGCTYNEESGFQLPDRVRGVQYDPATRTVEFRLSRGGPDAVLTPFSVRVDANYSSIVDLKNPDKVILGLPRPIGTLEQDGTITAQVPPMVELVASMAVPGLELTRQTTHELTWRYPRAAPETLELSWQPYRPPVQVTSLIDVTLLPAEARIRHELRYTLPQASSRLNLKLPAALAGRVQLREGGRLVEGRSKETVTILPADARQPLLILEYSVPLASVPLGEPVSIPLVVPEQTTRGETRVRLWSEGGPFALAAPGWSEQNIEIVAGRSQLPVLVVRSERVDQPLMLDLGYGEPATPALLERALARVQVAANGMQSYHVSYRVARLAARSLEIELPAPSSMIGLEVKLDGRQVSPEPVPTERAEQRGRIVRLRLAPDLVRKPAILDISYRLDPGRVQATTLTTPLVLPRLLGDLAEIPTRWQIRLPANRIVLAPEPGPSAPLRWGWRGWLPAPESAIRTAELERWFAGEFPPRPTEDEAPSLVLWHDGATILQLVHAPRQVWLLLCSLTVTLLGLALWWLSIPMPGGQVRTSAWLLLLTVLVLVLVVAFLWPLLASELAYGAIPGVLVLAVLGLVQWGLHERYRRQLVFLPSFSRSKQGSSLSRPEPARPPVEPSTVDVPRPMGSSVERTGRPL